MAHRRRAPVEMPKGQRYPGSGRKPGTPNRVSVEVRQLVAELVNDAAYQQKLRAAFRSRKLHPTIESLVWAYFLGKPTQPLQVSGGFTLDVRLEEERRLFATLDVRDLEQLAAESQQLMDRAVALARSRTIEGESARPAENPTDSLANTTESDNGRYVNPEVSEPISLATPDETEG